jgi:hypothetical protein
VGAFEAALQVCTRDRAPFEWAMTQNNLGSTLSIIGRRGDQEALRRSVGAFEVALDELSRHKAPSQIAMVNRNLMRARALVP